MAITGETALINIGIKMNLKMRPEGFVRFLEDFQYD